MSKVIKNFNFKNKNYKLYEKITKNMYSFVEEII